MSTNSRLVATVFSESWMSESADSRASGTDTTPTLGSMVQKG